MRSFDRPDSDTQTIVAAMQQIQTTPELQAQARTDLPGLLNRLQLSGIARHAVAAGLTLGLVATSVGTTQAIPEGFWN
jgi:hypothetical protein